MFPRWLTNTFSSPGEIIDLDKRYFGDNERLFITKDTPRAFVEINPETTGIGYIFKQSMPASVLEGTLEYLLGKIFDIEVLAVTASSYKLINDKRNFSNTIHIVKVYLELRKLSLWDTPSKLPALVFTLSLLNFFDYENCVHPEIILDYGENYYKLNQIYNIFRDASPDIVSLNPEHTFHTGITKFFPGKGNSSISLSDSIHQDLKGIQFILSSRENFQDAVRGKPLIPNVLTDAILSQYEKLRRKF
jgi:hypothetical protein